jgi:pilus assembly protein CpaE
VAKVPSILVVDESADSRVEVRKLLTRAGLTVAGETRYGVAASAAAHELQPDAVLVAIEEPPNRALETIEALARLLLETPIIGYSSQNDVAAVRRAVRAGARDYLIRPLQADAVRDAVFTALEQEEQRQLRRTGQLAPAVRGSVITVSGAKGGVGKSVVAINLALALRRVTGRSVALVDADTHFGDVATMLNVVAREPVTALIAAAPQLDRTTIVDYAAEHPSGVWVFTGATDPDEWRSATPERVERFIGVLAEAFDFVVVDTPDVFDLVVEQAIRDATMTLLVTNLDLSSISDSKVALRILERWNCPPEKVRLVVNITREDGDLRIGDVEQALGQPVFWTIPYEKRVPEAAQLGESVLLTRPNAAFSRTFRDLASAISGIHRRNGHRPLSLRRLLWWVPARAG